MTEHPMTVKNECKHRRTLYNEQDETLYCLQCDSWVIHESGEEIRTQP